MKHAAAYKPPPQGSMEARRRAVWRQRRRERHERAAVALLQGLLANPDVSRLAGSLLHPHGVGEDMRARLPELAFELAGKVLRLVAERYGGAAEGA